MSEQMIRLNDVWYSANGRDWILATDSAAWPPRDFFAAVVFQDAIWVFAGGHGGQDVWKSSNGVDWTQVLDSAPWLGRFSPCATVFHDTLWLMGGSGYADAPMNDCWYTTDGINWTLALANAPWSERYYACATVYRNRIWLLTGWAGGSTCFNDVWCSPALSAIKEMPEGECRVLNASPSILQSSLWLAPGSGGRANQSWLLDVTGRKILKLHPGTNDLRHLAPGVYFVHQAGTEIKTNTVRKVIIQR